MIKGFDSKEFCYIRGTEYLAKTRKWPKFSSGRNSLKSHLQREERVVEHKKFMVSKTVAVSQEKGLFLSWNINSVMKKALSSAAKTPGAENLIKELFRLLNSW